MQLQVKDLPKVPILELWSKGINSTNAPPRPKMHLLCPQVRRVRLFMYFFIGSSTPQAFRIKVGHKELSMRYVLYTHPHITHGYITHIRAYMSYTPYIHTCHTYMLGCIRL